MINPTEVIPGVLFYSYYSAIRKEKVAFLEHNMLVMQISGSFSLETASEKCSMNQGEMLLVHKNQLGELTKTPLNDGDYQTIVICLKEDLLRQIALEQQIEIEGKYNGPLNILIPENDFLQAFFQSVIPYVRHSEEKVTDAIGMLKVKEAVLLLLHIMPQLKDFLFDFSEPYKMDLEKFMLSNFHYNIPIEKFARLTGRSLTGFKRDFQKTFDMAPRHWLLDKRLIEARYLIEKKNRKPSAIYLDLGFETLSHFSHSFKKKFGKAPTG
jgi:AraC-like DNA-binding protein